MLSSVDKILLKAVVNGLLVTMDPMGLAMVLWLVWLRNEAVDMMMMMIKYRMRPAVLQYFLINLVNLPQNLHVVLLFVLVVNC